ncbi:DUF397 domain-containing protein [Streptomyces sp. AK04-3B]|uniref:DUF397 domain-containing protein n=1 Tax=Streptomyces sp. AK04-3B TaxID=3028650 RepID=UPI0029B95526|nr:DUF397 domain-containing protein [Streptomyces sp. AK04-3B]MDX3803736.1 DUF397 domain-containing protein [Streptomyces sp. AK04-3B]
MIAQETGGLFARVSESRTSASARTVLPGAGARFTASRRAAGSPTIAATAPGASAPYGTPGDRVEVEVALDGSGSGCSSGGDRMEGAACPARIHVRDSEAEGGPELALSPAAWAAFVTHAAK